ncbi:MAG: MFS transporter [bacterium]
MARPELSRSRAFVAVGYVFAVGMFGTTLPTPLYPLYQRELGFDELVLTTVFAAYAVGVLAALLLAGGTSDMTGRRPVLLTGLVLSAVSAVIFLSFTGLPALYTGRLLSGLSAGLITGTATATLLDLAPSGDRARASVVATLVNMGGLGVGPLVAGVVSVGVNTPLRIPFALDLVLLAPAFAAVWFLPEPVSTTGPLRPRPAPLGVPPEVRAVFVPAAVAGFAGFVVLGLFTAVGPAALGQLLSVTNRAAVGAVVFAVFAASTAGQMALELTEARRALPAGCLILVVGMVLLIGGLQASSLALLLSGGVVSGFGQGLSFRAGMSALNAATPPEQRAAVTSVFFVVLYIAISLPVVAVGLGARKFGLRDAGTTCAAVVAALALVAFAVLRMVRRQFAVAT